ncbi:N-acetylmuramoyl-L-alanine amidase family protein [Clostridium sp. ZBS2]|uniref:N-acetylmuramoyl-L-alanine amidase family protein n=1 Tax=Clostridium sp. ZBS2 TaxID=2949976 RepID=UPI00207A7B94|nr:N-acetylmuramoyl-L-alanine amidase family protein [Clostridium sp. ZBS2]
MFNRANKMTALLVAAAAVVSLVPATGVNAADVKRIPSKDGIINHAEAYKDGKFYVDGELEDKDEANYFYSNGKYTELDDLDSNSESRNYGEKYVNIDDGKYFVDLTNGKVTDDNIKEENKDDAEVALKKKVKDKAKDRYDDHDINPSLEEIAGNKFGETWYKAEYKPNGVTNGSDTENLEVYTDAKGNYIDADYNLGKIKIQVSTSAGVNIKDKSIYVENTDSEEKIDAYATKAFDDGVKKGDRLDVKATAKVTNRTVLAQDSKNIYRLATVTISLVGSDNSKLVIDEVYGNNEIAFNGINTNEVSFEVIQKISKDQASDNKDGAKYAKNVTSYVVCNKDGKLQKDNGNNEDVKNFKDAFLTGDINGENVTDPNFTVVNGTLVGYKENSAGELLVQTVNFKPKSGLYYIDANGDCSEDYDAMDVDVDGNIWRLENGFIYKFDNKDDWDKVYKVDGGMDFMSVYNKDNMVIWSDKNKDDEVYSIIGGKEDKEEEKPEVEVKTGWSQAADGTWTFVNADNTKATGWFQDGANWYLANAAGIMQTEWQTINGTWFYLGSNGAMQTGWQNINGAWYYLNPVSDGTRGAMKTGWINDNGTWYFADGSGKMLANTTVNGYVLGANGAWVK